MLCEMCGLRDAVISYAKFEEDTQVEIHLCQSCLEKKLKEDLHHIHDHEEGFADLIENMLQFFVESSDVETNTCPTCQRTWLDFKKSGKFGCAHCYDAFKKELLPLLESIQGSTQHCGVVSKSADTIVIQERQLEDLRHELEEAVRKEEYEKAAVLRDRIHDMLAYPFTKEPEHER